ncbi:MAG: PH domain-containing protein [Verrucomicrobiota bacterium]
MYSAFRQFCEQLLRIPPEPEPPPGDEAQTRIFLAARKYYQYLLVLWALKSVLTVLVILFILLGPMVAVFANWAHLGQPVKVLLFVAEAVGLVMALASAVFRLALVRLDFEKRWYVVTDRSLRVREGIFQVREATVTFANIQNISISQGPLQRALGIADLRVDTAGGGGAASHGKQGMTNLHTVWFRGVDNANEIKELMQQRLRQLKDSGLGDHEEMAVQTRMAGLAVSSEMVAVLREVRAEAEALRVATSRRFAG